MRAPRRLVPFLALLLVLLSSGATSAAAPPVPDQLARRFQDAIDGPVARRPLAGITAAVILPDGAEWRGASGYADVDRKQPMLPTTPIVMGSITKTYISAVILQLAEEGKLSIRDRLSRFLPDFPGARGIQLWQLMAHSSGLHDYFEAPSYERLVFGRPQHRWTYKEILKLVGRPYFKPGVRYHYSNTNYVLLGRIIRIVTGNSPAAEIHRRFLDPLGLTHTVLQGEEPLPPGGAKGYLWNGTRWLGLSDGSRFRPNTSAATVASTAGGILATAGDVAEWGRALYSGRLLTPASMTALETVLPHEPYGLGVRRFDLADGRIAWGHTGSLRGTVSYLWYLPAEDITVVLVTNRGRVNLTTTMQRLVQLAVDASMPAPPLRGARPATWAMVAAR
ncbi:MAG: serine hydrolase domain-containing protein [Chloroflexota bacterium]